MWAPSLLPQKKLTRRRTAKQPVIAVAFYSTWGHVGTLAESVIKGVEATGAIVKPYQFRETLPEDVLQKMYAGSSLKPKYPILTPDALREVDGLIIGTPTRYGRVPAQVSIFLDSCGQLWATGALVGKFVTMFTSAAGQHGGHETTALTTMPFFVSQGMVYVPIGYANKNVSIVDKVSGGAAWGASTVAGGQGERSVIPEELEVAEYQGKYFANFVATYVKGKQAATVGSSTHTGTTTAAASTISAAKEVPASTTQAEKGYAVPASTTTAQTAPTTSTASQSQTSAPKSTAPKAEQASAATTAPANKKGGIFASCCGGQGIDD